MSDETLREDDTWGGPRGEGPGSRIGPYTLVRVLGEGGFGDVYEAEQVRPVRRKVAMKILKLGMDTREVIARFALERQALAMMEHPHIARVLDAGATDSGRPFFVMELVEGEPITYYCDTRSMPIEDRLRLFEQVCEAVQHAHTKGVIHRDLKPGNVLVSTHDGRHYAKVIDFGIAKAVSGELTQRTLATRMDQVMGTPLYMSPEQARGSADIDTRSDIYALGVILYELLTGSTPVERTKLMSVSLADTQRLICDSDPPVPSARLLRAAASGTVGFHATEARALARRVRGELDWIVMKAIEKDAARRYDTASAFAMDVRRHLHGEPVLAAPPSAVYRIGKFVRRNKGTVAAGALVALALLVGVVGFAWQARVAQDQERLAKKHADELEKVAKYQAAILDQLDTTLAGKELSRDVQARYAAVLAHDGVKEPERSRMAAAFATQWQRINATDTATHLIDSTLLKPAVAAIDRQLRDQPEVDADLRQVLADRYYALGLYDAALPLQRSALANFQRLLGDADLNTINANVGMARLLDAQGQPAAAEPYARKAIASGLRRFGPDNVDTLEAQSYLAQVQRDQGKLDDAERILRDVLARKFRTVGKDDPSVLIVEGDLGGILLEHERPAEAEPFLRAAAEGLRRANGADNNDALTSANNLGIALAKQGKLKDAEGVFREVLEGRRHLLGEDHPDTLDSLFTLGAMLLDQDRFAAAEPLLREAADGRRRAVGADDAGTLAATAMYARVLVNRGRVVDAAAMLESSLPAARKTLGQNDPAELGYYLAVMGNTHASQHRFADAERELLEADRITRANVAPTSRRIRIVDEGLVSMYDAWNMAEPGKGHDRQAGEWKRNLAAAEGETTKK